MPTTLVDDGGARPAGPLEGDDVADLHGVAVDPGEEDGSPVSMSGDIEPESTWCVR